MSDVFLCSRQTAELCLCSRQAAELSEAAEESERRLAVQRVALEEAEVARQAQSDRLAETETELAAERTARLRGSQEADGLRQTVQRLELRLQEEQDRAETWRAESERAAAESERRAETETTLRWAATREFRGWARDRPDCHVSGGRFSASLTQGERLAQ